MPQACSVPSCCRVPIAVGLLIRRVRSAPAADQSLRHQALGWAPQDPSVSKETRRMERGPGYEQGWGDLVYPLIRRSRRKVRRRRRDGGIGLDNLQISLPTQP